MELLTTLLYILFVLAAIVLIVVVLLQEGRGGGLTDASARRVSRPSASAPRHQPLHRDHGRRLPRERTPDPRDESPLDRELVFNNASLRGVRPDPGSDSNAPPIGPGSIGSSLRTPSDDGAPAQPPK